jgi:hypothetical protein
VVLVVLGANAADAIVLGSCATTAVHCAKRVKSEVWPWVWGKVSAVPAVASVNQPLKV